MKTTRCQTKKRRWLQTALLGALGVFGVLSLNAQAPLPPGQNPKGTHIYLWAGLKSHLPGQHDYPQFLADWSKLLTDQGAMVDGALHAPSREDLERTDVLVIYKGDAGYPMEQNRAGLEDFVKRGGGIVSIHDSLCGPDPDVLASMLGGAKKHGQVNYTLDAPIRYSGIDSTDPIMADMSDFTIVDEAFFLMTWAKAPQVHVLASTKIPPTKSAAEHAGETAPQIWTYEHTVPGGKPARSFIWMQGHLYANLSNYQIQRTLLRGISWAAQHPVNELVDFVPLPKKGQSGTGARSSGGTR